MQLHQHWPQQQHTLPRLCTRHPASRCLHQPIPLLPPGAACSAAHACFSPYAQSSKHQQPVSSSSSGSSSSPLVHGHASRLQLPCGIDPQGPSSIACRATSWGKDSPETSSSNRSPPSRPSPPPSSPPPSSLAAYSPQQSQTRPNSAYQNRANRRSSAEITNESFEDDVQEGLAVQRYPSTPYPSLSSMDQSIDAYSNEELLRPNTSPFLPGRGGLTNNSSSAGPSGLSSYLSSAFPDAPKAGRVGRSRRQSMSTHPSYYAGNGLPMPGASSYTRDPFASFRAYQQGAPLQQGGGMGIGEGGEHLQAFRRTIMPKLRRGWFASSNYNAERLSQDILTRCERRPCGLEPLFMLVRLCESQEDARTALATISAVRAAAARLQGNLVPFMNQGGHNLAKAFTAMCCRCDASDVMASALIHASEVGLPITYKCVHLAMAHWAQLQELPKMEQVLDAMPQGGLPFNPKTAYVVIRGAVNAGRQEVAEMYAARMMAAGVRLHPSVNMLLEVGRKRANQRVEAMQWNEEA